MVNSPALRVVILGAGVAGLSAGARLSMRGHEVTLIEPERIGASAATLEREGLRFDLAAPAITIPAVFRDLFLKTGASLEDTVGLQPIDAPTRHVFADGAACEVPAVGPTQMTDAIAHSLGASAAGQWRTLTEQAAAMWQQARGDLTAAPSRRLLKSIERGLDLPKNPTLQQLVRARALAAGSLTTDALMRALPYLDGLFGTWHVPGGVGRMTDDLADRIRSRGGRILVGARADGLDTDATRIRRVHLDDGSAIDADIVIDADGPIEHQRELVVLVRMPSDFAMDAWTTVTYPGPQRRHARSSTARDRIISISSPHDPTMHNDHAHGAMVRIELGGGFAGSPIALARTALDELAVRGIDLGGAPTILDVIEPQRIARHGLKLSRRRPPGYIELDTWPGAGLPFRGLAGERVAAELSRRD